MRGGTRPAARGASGLRSQDHPVSLLDPKARLAARFAKILGYAPESFVALALQAQVEEAGLKLNVTVEAA